MIIIKDNEASEYYANYCLPSWEKVGLKVSRFNAVVPNNLSDRFELLFAKYSSGKKYTKQNLKVEITDTEKACFYSHYDLWKKSIDYNVPIFVIEHDSYLENPNNLWYESSCAIIFYDKAAMGSYVINPWFASLLCDFVQKREISSGPYALIRSFGNYYKISDRIVNETHNMYLPASNQVMSDKYGNTIEHWCNVNPGHFNINDFHKFIKI